MAIRVPPPGVSFGGFTVGPAGAVAPGSNAVALPAVSMQSPRPAPSKKKKNKNKQRQNQQQQQGQQQAPVTTSPASAPATDGKTAAEKREEQRRREAARRAAREEARRNRFNPLLTPFKTPAQLREEAIRLAEIGAPSEASLREQQQREEAGLTGLTTATAGALQNILGETQAGLRAFGDVYGRVGAGATSAAESALAAAGAPTSVAPTVSEADRARLGSQLAAYSAPLLGLPGAAQATGQRLIGASQANLAKALTQRASQISSDTAKYLQQLQGLEYEKAVAQETARQNAARLGLSAEEAQRDYEIAQANLGLRQESNQIRWAALAQSAANAAARATQKAQGNKAKGIQAAKADILQNITQWTSPSESATGKYEYTIYYTDRDQSLKKVPRTIVAANQTEAARLGASDVPDWARGTVEVEQGNAVTQSKPADFNLVARQMRQILMNEGMTKKAANAWIAANVSPYFR